MKRSGAIVATLLFAGVTACSSEPTNLLLGQWKLDAGAGAAAQSPYCLTPLQFAAKTQTTPDATGKLTTIPVTYVTGDTTKFPTVVYLLTDAGVNFHVTYRFLSKDKMILDNWLQCAYQRA